MAARLLEELPATFDAAVGAAFEAGVREGRKRDQPSRTGPMPSKLTPTSAPATRKPAFQREAAELREHVGRLGAKRVAEVLMLRIEDLGPLLQGRASVARAGMRRLRREA